MAYILDTNILIHKVRDSIVWQHIEKEYFPKGIKRNAFVSVVTIGEIRSFGRRNNWGGGKLAELKKFFSKLGVIYLRGDDIYAAYAQIDTYSQNKHKSRTLPPKYSARNMGKNDLWIAATAHAMGYDLISTDADFQHLDGVFFNFIYIDIAKIIKESKDI
ncbi:MAG: type II toxin-antitoxin system VapC family toxin [Chitinophagales bacterium]